MDRELFQKRLREARKKKKISAAVASELCGLSAVMVGRYETGYAVPKASALYELCELYEVSADYLLGRE